MVTVFCSNRKCRKMFDDFPDPTCPHCGNVNSAINPPASLGESTPLFDACEICGSNASLGEIDSGHFVCDSCFKDVSDRVEFDPSRDRPAVVHRVLTPPVTPPKLSDTRRLDSTAPTKNNDTQFSWLCPKCGVSLKSCDRQVGNSGPCPFCNEIVDVPPVPADRGRGIKPALIKGRQIGPKTFQWDCPRCGLANNCRFSSLGTRVHCKSCKLPVDLPRALS